MRSGDGLIWEQETIDEDASYLPDTCVNLIAFDEEDGDRSDEARDDFVMLFVGPNPAAIMKVQRDMLVQDVIHTMERHFDASELVIRLAGKNVHAIAGIGHPERFFATLRALGLQFEAHAFADHQPYQLADLAFGPQAVLLMTEKDAVKCAALPLSEAVAEAWVLPVTAQLPPALMDLIVEKLRGCSSA